MTTVDKHAHTKARTMTAGGVTWIDVCKPDETTFSQLENDYGLHPVHLKESIQKIQHTQIAREDEYLFLVLHFPIQSGTDHKIAMGQVGVFLGKNFLVTVRTAHSPAIEDLFTHCEQDPEQAKVYCEHGAAYLLYMLIRELLSDIAGITDAVESELDELEGLVFDNNTSDSHRISLTRQKIVRLRRIIGPKRFVLQDLDQQVDAFTSSDMKKYYVNNTNTANKLWETVEEARETIEIYKDADFTASTEQTNKVLTILTMAFTFTIPVTVAGTIYGMNVDLPGGIEAGPWRFLGTYTTFIILVAISSLSALAMVIYCKKKKWF